MLPSTQVRARGPSLKARAAGFLARREYSRQELARKLIAYSADHAEVARVLDELEREGWLSTERFAHSLALQRAPRQGTARIVQELKQRGVEEAQIAVIKNTLTATEYARAFNVWKKRFGDKPTDRETYIKQVRFLMSRGFANEVIRRILEKDE